MSSGNPFRASPLHNPAASSPVPQTSFIAADSTDSVPEDGRSGPEGTGAPPLRTKKHVRIQSDTTFIPPQPDADDTDDSPRSPVAQHLDRNGYLTPSPSDVFAGQTRAQNSTGGQDMAALGIWASSSRGYQPPQSVMSPIGVPANPFSRTLASMGPQEKDTGEERTWAERAALRNNRASLDVESFKNLLMTGKRAPQPSGLSSQSTASASSVPAGPQFESSSSTDTSSISRQSLFESSQHTQPESSRTSLEIAGSDEDESMGLMSEVKRGKKQPPPAPPKHRHGKLVTPRQPQTVSFESFSASEPATPSITRPRDNSDASKPLPPTPVVSPQPQHTSPRNTSQQPPAQARQQSSESLATTEITKQQKRAPPPVPLARRQSQLKSSSVENRSRSNSSLTMTSQHSIEIPLMSPTPSNKDPLPIVKSPPPPPRSRHGARLTDSITSSVNSSAAELPRRSTSGGAANSTQRPSSSIQSTPDSSPASPDPNIHRTPSISSTRNTTSRVVSTESTSSLTMPPPPPPPRRRQSNRSSLDQQRPRIPISPPTQSRRTSIENHTIATTATTTTATTTTTSPPRHRRTSIASESSLRREYAGEKSAGMDYALDSPAEHAEHAEGITHGDESMNILDDMDKFQRELEALRLRYAKAK